MLRHAVAFVLLLAPCAVAQTASYTLRPNSCDSWLPLQVQGLPRLGQSVVLSTYASTSFASLHGFVVDAMFIMTGFSDRSFAGVPLPCDLTRFGLDACGALHVSVDVLTPVASGAYQQVVPTSFLVPNDPSLLGLEFHQQALLIEAVFAGSRLRGLPMLVLSASGHARIGL
jgi:hypothetical protein